MKGVKPKNFEEMQKLGWAATRGSKRPHSEETKRKIGLANKGRKATEETKAILSEARKNFYRNGGEHPKGNLGRKAGAEHRRKISEALKGEKCYRWRGGVTPEHEAQRKSFEYKKWRDDVFKRDDWTCVLCHSRGGKLNADHIKPFSLYPELRLDVHNGRTLCVGCHGIITKQQHKENMFTRSVETRFKSDKELQVTA